MYEVNIVFFELDNTRLRIFFFVARNAKLFVQNLTLGYMTKTLNQIIVFFLHQNQNIFLEKKSITPPPLEFKWSFPNVDQLGSTDYGSIFPHIT
jgi:hypothetical protein